MANLVALNIVAVSGVSSFTASPGNFYRVDTSGGNVAANLVAVSTTDSTAWLIVKKITSDANVVNVTPHSGDDMNGSGSANQLTSGNQSRMYMPNTPVAFGSGWVSW